MAINYKNGSSENCIREKYLFVMSAFSFGELLVFETHPINSVLLGNDIEIIISSTSGCALQLVEAFWLVENFVSECLNFN